MASPHPPNYPPKPPPSPKPPLLPSPRPASTSPSTLPTTTSPTPHATPFTPFFTLITDPTDTTHHHPTVHYLFSDDPDTDLITTAALQTLSPPSSPATEAQTSERFLLLDVDATGTKVLSARSMAPGWAVTGAEVRAAPTWEGDGEGEGEGGRGMMVRIEGLERDSGRTGVGEGESEGLERLVEKFERGLGELRRVVEGGGGK